MTKEDYEKEKLEILKDCQLSLPPNAQVEHDEASMILNHPVCKELFDDVKEEKFELKKLDNVLSHLETAKSELQNGVEDL